MWNFWSSTNSQIGRRCAKIISALHLFLKKLAVDLDRPLEIMDSLSSGTSSFGLGLGSSIDGGGGVVTVTEFAKD